MFPSAKRRKMSSGQPPRKDRDARPPKRNGPGGKGRKQSRDGEKPFGKKTRPGGKTFGAKKAGDREKKFGGKKRFEGNKTFGGNKNKDKSFRAKGQKAKPGFKKRGAGAKQGFKQRKGKGWSLHSSSGLGHWMCYHAEQQVAASRHLPSMNERRLLLKISRGEQKCYIFHTVWININMYLFNKLFKNIFSSAKCFHQCTHQVSWLISGTLILFWAASLTARL